MTEASPPTRNTWRRQHRRPSPRRKDIPPDGDRVRFVGRHASEKALDGADRSHFNIVAATTSEDGEESHDHHLTSQSSDTTFELEQRA